MLHLIGVLLDSSSLSVGLLQAAADATTVAGNAAGAVSPATDTPQNAVLSQASDYLAAAAALGTAAFALVDASKAFGGGTSNIGFHHIQRVLARFIPDAHSDNPLDWEGVKGTLRANWLNGMALDDQKAIAKSLIKLRLDPDNAPRLAEATGTDGPILAQVAQAMIPPATTPPPGAPPVVLSPIQQYVNGRFNLILTAMLDEAYQRADQSYRNWSRVWAMIAAILLAILGMWFVVHSANPGDPSSFWKFMGSRDFWSAVIAGFIAVPVAPIAKDLTSGLAAGVKMAQTALGK